MADADFERILTNSYELAKRVYAKMRSLRANRGDQWDAWDALPQDEQISFEDAVWYEVCRPAQDLLIDLRKQQPSQKLFPEPLAEKHERREEFLCYTCSRGITYSLGGACEECLKGMDD